MNAIEQIDSVETILANTPPTMEAVASLLENCSLRRPKRPVVAHVLRHGNPRGGSLWIEVVSGALPYVRKVLSDAGVIKVRPRRSRRGKGWYNVRVTYDEYGPARPGVLLKLSPMQHLKLEQWAVSNGQTLGRAAQALFNSALERLSMEH